jgi:hypothetical protein
VPEPFSRTTCPWVWKGACRGVGIPLLVDTRVGTIVPPDKSALAFYQVDDLPGVLWTFGMSVGYTLLRTLVPRVAFTAVALGKLGWWYTHAFVLVGKPAMRAL